MINVRLTLQSVTETAPIRIANTNVSLNLAAAAQPVPVVKIAQAVAKAARVPFASARTF